MNYLECIPLTLFDRITVWIIKIKRERKGSANKIKFIVSFIVLPIHLLPIHHLPIHVLPIHVLPIHLLPIQSMFYKSSPLHSSPCFTTCLNSGQHGMVRKTRFFLRMVLSNTKGVFFCDLRKSDLSKCETYGNL